MNWPRFSIIIPTYNRPEQCLKAVFSVINQIYTHWELAIINDGSEQPYNNLIQQIKAYKNIKYYYKKNEGLSSTRNFGVSHTKEKFVCFLDDDDYYLPNHLKVLANEIMNKGGAIGLYHTMHKNLMPDGTYQIPIFKPKNLSQSYNEYYLTNDIISMNNCCYPRQLIEQYPFNINLKINEENDQWHRIFSTFPTFAIPIPTTVYVRSGEDRITNYTASKIEDRIKSWKEIFNDKAISSKIRQSYRNQVLYQYHYLIIHNHRTELTLKRFLNHSLKMVTTNLKLKTILTALWHIKWKLQGK
jgi:glycosyltransferase involved in cell wall biosynthesis